MTTPWRLLLTGAGEPGFNMALDEALATAGRRGWSPPTLRIFRWRQPAVSLGCHQPVEILKTIAALHGRHVAVVRRPTAGGTVVHDQDISYAFAAPQSALRGWTGRTLYRRFHEALRDALAARALVHHGGPGYTLCDADTPALRPAPAEASPRPSGQPDTAVCFQQPVRDDLLRGPAKVAGAAQRRWRDGLLQQGTVQEPSLSTDRVALCVRMAWSAVFDRSFTVGALTVQERVLADELWSKYRPWMFSSWPPDSRRASILSR